MMWWRCFSTASRAARKDFLGGLTFKDRGFSMAERARSYLDYNATAPLRPEVAGAVARALELIGNPSSIHAEGRAARAAVEAAREKVARLVGAEPKNVILTSGGTEAAGAVLSPSLHRLGENAGMSRLLASAGEHPCVLERHGFSQAAERIPRGRDGVVDLAWLEARLESGSGEPALVSVQTANNETGVVQPVAAAAALVHRHRGLIHTDAVQA